MNEYRIFLFRNKKGPTKMGPQNFIIFMVPDTISTTVMYVMVPDTNLEPPLFLGDAGGFGSVFGIKFVDDFGDVVTDGAR